MLEGWASKKNQGKEGPLVTSHDYKDPQKKKMAKLGTGKGSEGGIYNVQIFALLQYLVTILRF